MTRSCMTARPCDSLPTPLAQITSWSARTIRFRSNRTGLLNSPNRRSDSAGRRLRPMPHASSIGQLPLCRARKRSARAGTIREKRVGECYSYRQFCSLGPLPPRTPARPDPQVPRDRKLGSCVHGKIGAFYFYEKGSNDDPAFGFIDGELSVQDISTGKVRVELYCVADGYQTSRGV